jgi:hypothetical protein
VQGEQRGYIVTGTDVLIDFLIFGYYGNRDLVLE